MEVQSLRREDVELLAPAGDWDCMRAAVANGADAIFFGVEKFNARARANNFRMDELPEIMAFLHSYGVKGFLTFNILVFEDELADAKQLIDACIDAGVDAVIVQDLGLVKMIREISPDFPIHGSTQMTITSPEAVEFTKPFNMERVVLGRENNLKQIQKIGEQAKLPMEVFVHGALCVSYSGQCLTSEMWGGRSANRGECAQACRLPYDLMVDGEQKPMGDVAYLLSPKDLAAIDIMPELIEAGVTSFKIEGRLKSPEYVANVVSKYRKAIDLYFDGNTSTPSREEIRELQQSFSRGFTHGFLEGTNNKKLVDGTFPKSRGVYLGRVEQILRDGVVCRIEAPLKRGDGIVFDAGDPTKKKKAAESMICVVRASSWRAKPVKAGLSTSFQDEMMWIYVVCTSVTASGRRMIQRWISGCARPSRRRSLTGYSRFMSKRSDIRANRLQHGGRMCRRERPSASIQSWNWRLPRSVR